MRIITAKQMANASYAGGPKGWRVKASYNSAADLHIHATNITHREARAIREACGYAYVERVAA